MGSGKLRGNFDDEFRQVNSFMIGWITLGEIDCVRENSINLNILKQILILFNILIKG